MNLRHLGRARLRVCLLVVTAACAASLFIAPAASATSFAALLSGSQAGSDQNQNLVWVNSAGAPDVDLRFEAAMGYWPHMHQIGRRCAADTARTSGCPAASKIASIVATYGAPGALPVIRTGYLALAGAGSGELRGHDVLLVFDQNSRYGVTVKPIRIELKRVAGHPAVELNIGSAPRITTTGGAVSPLRLSSLTISGQQRWMRNPTACGTNASITAVATFADGRTEAVRRTPNITGCGTLAFDQPVEVMFNPREYTISKKSSPSDYIYPRASGFDLHVGLGEHADGERVTDARSLRVWVPGKPKYEDIAKLPFCDEQAALADACPAGSQVGEFCVESGPSRETACGALRAKGIITNTGTGGGGKIQLLATLSKGGGGGGGAGGILWVGQASIEEYANRGGIVIVLDGLPQADVHSFSLKGDNPLYENSGSCGSNPLHGDLAGWSGATREMTGVMAFACTPGIETTDARDADLDGDGVADDPLRPATFSVPFKIAPLHSGIESSSISCSYVTPGGKLGGAITKSEIENGIVTGRCTISGAPGGDGELQISAAGLDGHVTVLKLGFTVDDTPPSIAIDEPGAHIFDGFPPLFFDVVEEHPGSSLCELIREDEPAGVVFTSACAVVDQQTGEVCDDGNTDSGDGCRRVFVIPHVLETSGRYRAAITHTDAVGNKGTASVAFIVDRDPPVLSTVNPIDADDDGDGIADSPLRSESFEVEFDSFDAGIGVDLESPACGVETSNGSGLPKVTPKIAKESHGKFRCAVEGAESGPLVVVASVKDLFGHVTVLKLGFTVDAQGPIVTLTKEIDADLDGDGFADRRFRPAFFDVFFETTDEGFGVDWIQNTCAVRMLGGALPGGAILSARLADVDGDGRPDVCRIENAPEGDAEVSISVVDGGGHVTVLKLAVTVDDTPPSIAIDEPGAHITGDPDFDLLFTADDNSLDAGGPLSASCTRKGWDGTIKGSAKLTKADAGRALAGECSFTGVADGIYEVELSVFDASGHVTVLKHSMTVDTTAPSISGLSPADGDWIACPATDDPAVTGVVPIKFTLSDSSEDLASVEVSFNRGPRQTVSLDGSYQHTFDMAVDCREMTTGMDVEYRVYATDRAGNKDEQPATVLIDKSPPVLATVDPRDDDSDGDGFADDQFRPSSFELFFDTYEEGSGIAEGGVTCELEGPAGRAVRGKVKVVRDTGSGFACQVEEAGDGPLFVIATASDASGHVTVLKLGFTVDATGPAIRVTRAQDDDADGDGYADERFRRSSFTLPVVVSDAISGVDENRITCEMDSPAALADKGKIIVINDGTGGIACQIDDAPDGELTVTLTAPDIAGHRTVLKRTFTVDTTGPVVTFTGPADADSDGDGVADDPYRPAEFDVPLSLDDAGGSGVDPNRSSCTLVHGGSIVSAAVSGLVDSDGDGSIDACRVTNAPDGTHYLLIIAWDDFDNPGPPASLTLVVDSTEPQLVTSSTADADSDGDGTADAPVRDHDFGIWFDTYDEGSGIDAASFGCQLQDENGAAAKGKIVIIKDGEGGYACQFSEVQTGRVKVVATVRDHAGNVVLIGHDFIVDDAAPSLVLTDPRDGDADVDGIADDPYRESSFSIPFVVENDPDGKAVQSATCNVRGWDPATKKPIIGVADTDGDGAPDVCRIEGAPAGKFKIEIGAAGPRGIDVVIREFIVRLPDSPPAA